MAMVMRIFVIDETGTARRMSVARFCRLWDGIGRAKEFVSKTVRKMVNKKAKGDLGPCTR